MKLFNKKTYNFKKNLFKYSKSRFALYNNYHSSSKYRNDEIDINHKESIGDYDVAIVGAGPSGLSAAIHLKSLAALRGKELKICVFEKAAEVGAHILSGAVIEPKSLTELIPEWKELGAPLNVEAKEDKFLFMTQNNHYRLPTPPQMHNEGNYIVSLSNVVRWLGEQAEKLGIEIYPDCPISEVLYDEKGNVSGVGTAPKGLDKEGKPKDTFQNGFTVNARLTLLAEGCRGSVTKTLFDRFNLRSDCEDQVYGLGIKELWEIDPSKHDAGSIVHTVGWPLDPNTYGGSWLYHLDSNMISIGYVVGLNYTNPTLSPYKTFQQFKHHPYIRNLLEGGKCIGYGARTISAGGLQSLPKLAFPGGALIGDCAGFSNVPKIKGTHTAMKSGIIVAEAAAEKLLKDEDSTEPIYLDNYYEKFRNSWLYSELRSVRNIKPAFSKFGLYGGIINGAIDTYLFRGHAPWTFSHGGPDHKKTKPIKEVQKIEYPKPDGKISFDLLSNLVRSNTNHPDDIPIHLKLKNPEVQYNELNVYGGPSSNYCPAGVYEWVDAEDGKKRFQINSQNCIHCKTCDIKDPNQNINWTVPEGGGPLYSGL